MEKRIGTNPEKTLENILKRELSKEHEIKEGTETYEQLLNDGYRVISEGEIFLLHRKSDMSYLAYSKSTKRYIKLSRK